MGRSQVDTRVAWLLCLGLVFLWGACQPRPIVPGIPAVRPKLEDAQWLPAFDPLRSAEPMASARRDDGPQADLAPPKLIHAAGPRGETSLSTALQFVFDASLRALGEFDFHTPRPTVHLEVPEEPRVQWTQPVVLRAEAGIRIDLIDRHVRATASIGEGKVVDIPVRVRQAARAEQAAWHLDAELGRVIEPRETWPRGATVVVEVDGALPTTGTSRMGVPVRASFSVQRGLVIEEVDCGGGRFDDGCGVGPITLLFSNPVPRAQLRHIRPTPPVRGFEIRPGYERETAGVVGLDSAVLWGDFKRGDAITLTAARLSDVFGQPLAEPFSHTVKFVDPPLQLTLRPGRGTLPLDRPLHLGVEARWLASVLVSVAPLDPLAFAQLDRKRDLSSAPWPGEVVRKEITLPQEGAFGWSSHAIDLGDFVGDRRGPVLVEVAPGRIAPRGRGRPVPEAVRQVYQVTGLGLSGMTSLPRSIARVTRLPDQAPVPGARVVRWTTKGAQEIARTDAQGRVELGSMREWSPDAVIEVVKKDDRLVYDARPHGKKSKPTGATIDPHERVLASVTTERGAYRADEKIHVTGWSAIATPHNHVGLRTTPAKTPVTLVLRDRLGVVVGKKRLVTTPEGKFWGTLHVPADATLGHYEVAASLLGVDARADVVVEDFRSSAFEVSVTTPTPDIHVGDPIQVKTTATYYFGDTVPMTSIDAHAECQPAYPRPPGFDTTWSVGWGRSGREDAASGSASVKKPDPGRGHVELTLVPTFTQRDRPYHCNIAVAVGDASAQGVGADTSVRVHPDFYLMLERTGSGKAPHDAAIVVRTVDHTGATVPVDDIVAEITRSYTTERTRMERGKPVFDGWVDRTETLPPCRIATSEAKPAPRCELPALPHGSYAITLSARRSGRPYVAWVEENLWVENPKKRKPSGAETRNPISVDAKPDFVTLDVRTENLSVGTRINARISAPFDGSGELVVAAGGVRKAVPFSLTRGTARVPLEIDEAWVPGAQLVAMVPAPAGARPLARVLWEDVEVHVPPTHRRLSVEVHMPSEAQPRAELPIEVRVADSKGKPVVANVSIWAVDDAVLSLYPATATDLVHVFAPRRPPGIDRLDSLSALVLPFSRRSDPYVPKAWKEDGLLEVMGLGSGAGFGGSARRGHRAWARRARGGSEPLTERSAFETAPLYIGNVRTDARGVAHVKGRLPDNLTTFRVTATASAGLVPGVAMGRFGVGQERVRVTRPIVVRPVLPRMLRPGDVADLRLIVQNIDGPAGPIDLELERVTGADALELLSPAKTTLTVDQGGQAQAAVRVRARTVGTPQLRVTARHRRTKNADIIRLPLPIEHDPTVLERVAHYGEVASDRPIALPLKLPGTNSVDPSHGGLSVSMTSTLLGGLEDAAHYLVEYPHGCLEQTSSRLMPLVALGDLARHTAIGIDPKAFAQAGIARLQAMQLPDGGFSSWPGGTQVEPYASAYATWVLVRAQRAGIDVPKPLLRGALASLARQIEAWSTTPAPSIDADLPMIMGLQALADANQRPRDRAFEGVWERREALPVFAQAMLLMAMHKVDPTDARLPPLRDALLAHLDDRNDSPRIHSAEQRWWRYFDSPERNVALVLSALLQVAPEHPSTIPLARALLQSRRTGRWSNTQENAYALLALADYARLREHDEPRFDATVWLAGDPLVHHRFRGRSTAEQRTQVPMQALLNANATDRPADPLDHVLLLHKQGPGRLYYRVGLDWAPAGPAPARTEGIGLRRTLRNDAGEIADHAIPLGTQLAIDLDVTATRPLTFVALQIPLPAGLEGVNRELGGGAGAMRLSGQRGAWVTHEEFRADRIMIYADALPPGRHRTTVFVRATTPGTFHWPAAVGEMMYAPEVYGRTDASTVVVRPR